MEQKEAVMVLFDREEEYARLLSEFLRRQKELPWEIHTYTKMEELLEREKNGTGHTDSACRMCSLLCKIRLPASTADNIPHIFTQITQSVPQITCQVHFAKCKNCCE